MYSKHIKITMEEFLARYFNLTLQDDKKNLDCLQDAVDLIQEFKELGETSLFNIVESKNEFN